MAFKAAALYDALRKAEIAKYLQLAAIEGAIRARGTDGLSLLAGALLLGWVGAWLAEIRRPTFVVSHGGVGRVVRHLILGASTAEAAGLPFPQDKALVIREGRGDWL